MTEEKADKIIQLLEDIKQLLQNQSGDWWNKV